MPKEHIYAENYGRELTDLSTGKPVTPEYPLVVVEWAREKGFVQMVTGRCGEPSTMRDIEGWYLCLDREGINRLIRTLRKARDQAFGADA